MTWTKTRHICPPSVVQVLGVAFAAIGDEWTCDRCHRVYIVTEVDDVKKLVRRGVLGAVPKAVVAEGGVRATRAEQWKEQAERERERANLHQSRADEMAEAVEVIKLIVTRMQDTLDGVLQPKETA